MFRPDYTRTWIRVAEMNPDILFFGYTKNHVAYDMLNNVHYSNLGFAFSWGSRHDSMVRDSDVVAYVATTPDEIESFESAGIPVICRNDEHSNPFKYSEDFDYIMGIRHSFALEVH
jgi:hypothetical protein